jgi:hypothetical protein
MNTFLLKREEAQLALEYRRTYGTKLERKEIIRRRNRIRTQLSKLKGKSGNRGGIYKRKIW